MTEEPLKIFDIKNDCTGCGACVSVCPKGCLSLEYDEEGFLFPKGDMSACINCRKCESSCHVLSGSIKRNLEKPVWWNKSKPFMFINGDNGVRMKSTSGGAMSAFANHVISEGGVLFTSRYNGRLKRLEYASTDQYPLEDFRKSRYIESNTNGIYTKVKAELGKGRKVLFVGTPCQVSGLKQFLGKNADNENLLTINFVCHGVPSNEIFHQHVAKKYYKGELSNLDFRYKDDHHGWHQMFLKLYNKDRDITVAYGTDEFYRSFCANDFLRRSCYVCNYLFNNFADITIADFWGIRKYIPGKDDNKGVSLIILHNEKAERLLSIIRNSGECTSLPYDSIEYLIAERKAYHLSKRFKGNKTDYLSFIKRQYMWTIRKFKVKQWIKAIIRK